MPGITPTRVERLVTRAASAGIPTTVVPAEPVQVRTEVDPAESAASAAKLLEHIADPEGVPLYHAHIKPTTGVETVTAVESLDPDKAWFFLGFAYALIPGIEESLLTRFQRSGNRTIPVSTHFTPKALAEIKNATFSRNPLSGRIQGIPHSQALAFKDYVASYRFFPAAKGSEWKESDPPILRPGDMVWRLDWLTLKIADPFRQQAQRINVATEVNFALPLNLTTGRGIRLLRLPGPALATPQFGVIGVDDPESAQYA